MPKRQSTAARRARAATREGAKYTTVLRAEETGQEAAGGTFPGDGGPWVSAWVPSIEHDVNPVCGHHARAQCGGCMVCTTCDGCYCAEAAEEARIDAECERDAREHAEHDAHRTDCHLCEYDRERTAGYTRCPKCSLPYPDGFGDHVWHGAYCSPLPRYRAGVDWSYLRGQEVTLVGREYSVHGLVLADQEPPDPGDYMPMMRMRRTDPGYEDGPDETSPFCPREWLEVRPAPPTHA